MDILLSDIYYGDIVKKLCDEADIPCDTRDGRLFTTCDTNAFPDVIFRVGGVDLMARSGDIIDQEHHEDDDWGDNRCGTNVRRINAPFHILGRPVLQDYKIVFQHEQNYMSFMYGGNRAKEVPRLASQNVDFKNAVKPAFDWETSDTPKMDALLIALVLYFVIAAIPITSGLLLVDADDTDMVSIVIGTSLILTWPIVQFLIFPALVKYFSRPSEERKVRNVDDALWEIYGI